MAYLQRQALAKSTRRTYRSGRAAFRKFCYHHSLRACPASPATVGLFATSLSRGATYQTVKTYLAAISSHHKQLGWQDPVSGNPQLQLLTRGIRRVKAHQTSRRVRQPITLVMLRDLCKAIRHLKLHTQDKAMLRSALTLAFFGCLRVSEFTHAQDRRTISALRSDVSASRQSVVYHLRYSKTDQYGRGSHIAISSREEAICPCKAMLDYLRLSKDRPTAPLYRFRNGSPLTRASFVRLLKHLTKRAGYNPSNFNSHSLRIGSATLAAEEGHSGSFIKRLGRWRSDTYQRYVRL